jgi:hypothetical protein
MMFDLALQLALPQFEKTLLFLELLFEELQGGK